jgi:YbbR domain-containing protein
LLVPSAATATGPANEVDSIARLVVKPDVTGATDTVDDDYQILPVDAQGNEVPDVQVSPQTAHVQIGVVEAGRTKEVFITPKITGAPAPGFVIGNVVVKPATTILSGSVDQLSNVSNVSTEPIDIQGANSDLTRQVRCIVPPGTTATAAAPVSVTIQIISATTPAQPVPAAPQPH